MRALSAALERALEREASTRSAALLRIGLALIIWTRFADLMTLGSSVQPIDACILLAFWLSTLAMAAGLFAQVATAATALTLIASAARYGVVLKQETWLHHHVYLLVAATIGCALTPSGRSYSLDRWFAIARSERSGTPLPPERGRVGALYLIAVQLSAVYFWGAINKSTLGWLSGDKFESQLLVHIFDSDPPAIAGWRAFLVAASVATVVLEYALAIGLWFRRARRWLIPAGIAFHTLIYLTLPVTVFSALTCLLYLTYFDPDDVHGAIDRISRTERRREAPARGHYTHE